MVIALTGLLASIAGGTLGWLIGWSIARRARDPVLRLLEMELATTKAQLNRDQQLAHQLATTRAEFARADAIARMLTTEVTELRGAQQRLARAEAELRASSERREALESELGALEPLQERCRALTQALARTEALLEAERGRTAERVAESEANRQNLRLEFEALGQRLLEEKGRTLLEQNHKNLEGLLTPVRERLKEFQEKFQLSSDQDNRDRASLLERLKLLQETQTRLHEDAAALSRALTGESRAQGDWGELVLESLLATAGLTEGREYELQVDHQNEEGRHRRPDALVYLPPDRAIVIDAKCSLQAFIASTRAASEDERETDLEAHVASLRTHVKLLAAKDYQSVLNARSLDFVFLFVPSEAAFHAALSRCPTLSEEAMRQRVVICSPTTVLATLQMVHHVWRSERQSFNAQRIAEEAGRMVDKVAAVLASFNEVGDRLSQAQQAFEIAKGRLSTGKGNVVHIATRVLELGARAGKPERLLAAQKAMDAALPEEAEAETPAQTQLQLEAEL